MTLLDVAATPCERWAEVKPQHHDLERYEVLGVSGSGVYGTVYRAINKETKETVALKKIEAYADANDGAGGVPSHVVREVSLLKGLQHPNIVRISDVIIDQASWTLVFEYVPMDLYRHLRSFRKAEVHLPFDKVQKYTRELAAATCYCHCRLVVHRDIKPQNILVSEDGIKLCDFGLARTYQVPLRPYTHEVLTLWYRAPEILLGAQRYGPEIDVWSVGCVLAEMAAGFPVFAGDSEIGTLFKIFQLLGTPTEQVWPQLTDLANWNDFFPKWNSTELQPIIEHRPETKGSCAELLKGLLSLKPSQRMTSRKALMHPFCSPVDEEAQSPGEDTRDVRVP